MITDVAVIVVVHLRTPLMTSQEIFHLAFMGIIGPFRILYVPQAQLIIQQELTHIVTNHFLMLFQDISIVAIMLLGIPDMMEIHSKLDLEAALYKAASSFFCFIEGEGFS